MSDSSVSSNSCKNCTLSYISPWCKGDVCIFCIEYLPMRDTYTDILNDARNRFLFSLWNDEATYYKQHVAYIIAWCAMWHIPPTPSDIILQQTLLQHKNWTREYWH